MLRIGDTVMSRHVKSGQLGTLRVLEVNNDIVICFYMQYYPNEMAGNPDFILPKIASFKEKDLFYIGRSCK